MVHLAGASRLAASAGPFAVPAGPQTDGLADVGRDALAVADGPASFVPCYSSAERWLRLCPRRIVVVARQHFRCGEHTQPVNIAQVFLAETEIAALRYLVGAEGWRASIANTVLCLANAHSGAEINSLAAQQMVGAQGWGCRIVHRRPLQAAKGAHTVGNS